MTVLEFFKNNDAETIAKSINDYPYGLSEKIMWLAEAKEGDTCLEEHEDCQYLDNWAGTEDYVNYEYGRCELEDCSLCPHHVDRKQAHLENLIEILNSEIEVRAEED